MTKFPKKQVLFQTVLRYKRAHLTYSASEISWIVNTNPNLKKNQNWRYFNTIASEEDVKMSRALTVESDSFSDLNGVNQTFQLIQIL
jgi:hypothetical protein